MNSELLHQAFRRGHLAEQQGNSFDFTLPLDALKQTPDGWLLGVDLAELIQRGVEQATHSSDVNRSSVAVVRLEAGRGLVFKLIDVVVPDAPVAPPALLDPPPECVPVAQQSTAMPLLGEVEGRPNSQPLKVPDSRDHTALPVRQPATMPLGLAHRTPDPVDEAEDMQHVHKILTLVKLGKLRFLEEIEAMITDKERVHNPRQVRAHLINVLPTWSVTHTCLEDLNWEGLTGLTEPLPMQSRLLLEGIITAVQADGDIGEVRLAGVRVVTKGHELAVQQCTLKSTPLTKLTYFAADEGLRLSLFHGFGRKVMMAAQVSRCLAINSPWHLRVIDTFPADASEFDLKRYRHRLEAELMRRPPADDFWLQRELPTE